MNIFLYYFFFIFSQIIKRFLNRDSLKAAAFTRITRGNHFSLSVIMTDAGQPTASQLGSFLRQLQVLYKATFEGLFHITAQGALQCTNNDVARFNQFVQDFAQYFSMYEIFLNNLTLIPAGKGQIDIVNKTKILKLYGIAYHVYMRTCTALRVSPSNVYGEVVIVKLEDE